MIKILVVDDHPIVRAGLKQILAESDDLVVAGEASNSQEALEKVSANNFDVVLLDIAMPGRSGLDIIKDLKNEQSDLSVLVLSYFPEEQYAIRALKAGSSGYLVKKSAPDELVEAIQIVSRGRKYISASVAEKLVDEMGGGEKKAPHERLSDREYQILRMISSGKSVTDIADNLCLSVKTISTYRSRLLRKMEMKNNAEIISYAIKQGLVD